VTHTKAPAAFPATDSHSATFQSQKFLYSEMTGTDPQHLVKCHRFLSQAQSQSPYGQQSFNTEVLTPKKVRALERSELN